MVELTPFIQAYHSAIFPHKAAQPHQVTQTSSFAHLKKKALLRREQDPNYGYLSINLLDLKPD
jgi:hypothetical protein